MQILSERVGNGRAVRVQLAAYISFLQNHCAKACTRIALTLDHCGCQATCQNRLMRVDACDSNCACACVYSCVCLCEIIKCASGGQLQDNVPERACVHLCVHTCICMALPVYTTVLAQGLARWHCARFKCVLISASFLLLRLMPVFCWSVYPALSRLSHKTCFLSVTFIPKCQHEIKVKPVYFHVWMLQCFSISFFIWNNIFALY